MSDFPFDELHVENCRVNQNEASADVCDDVDVPGTDERCADPAFRKANPELCKDFPLLVIKPSVMSLCQLQSKKLAVFLYANSTEVELTSGLVWSSSNQLVAMIGATSGKVTGLSEGIATIAVTWQNLTATAQFTILPAACCDDTKVGMAVVVDNSLSMTMGFGAQYATKLSNAKALAYRFVGELNVTKDVMALMTFNDAGSVVLPLGNDVTVLKNKVTAITSTQNSTNIADALSDAIALLDADTTLSRKVVVMFTDGENHLGDDPVPIADAFEEAGGVIIVVGIRAFGDGYDILNRVATGGFFLNSHIPTYRDTFEYLSGLKGYICAGNCSPPGDVTINRAYLNYTGFANWDVTGVVDIIGGTPPYELFDLLPGNDLYVDLAGSSGLGKLTSKTTFTFEPGITYRLAFRMAGNQREFGEGYIARIQVIGIVDEQIQEGVDDFNWDTPFTDFFYDFTVPSSTTAKISFEQVSSFTAAFGELLDSVLLVQDPDGAATILFEDDFADENATYIPPKCGPSVVAGYGYGYDCYGYGCLTDPVPVQIEDPSPAPDTIEEGAPAITGGGGTGGNGGTVGSFDPAGMFPTYSYLSSLIAKYLPLAGGTMTGFITLHAAPTAAMHAANKSYVDSMSSGGAFVELAGDTMTGDLNLQNARLGIGPSSGAADTFLSRDSANTFAMKNGANAQGLNLYKTVVGADYERLHIGWSGNVAYLRTQGSGGAFETRPMEIQGVLTLSQSGGILSAPLAFTGTDHLGLRLNSLTEVERDLATPVNGDAFYNSTASAVQVYQGGAWVSIGAAVGGAPFSDADPIMENAADDTKLLAFSLANIATLTTRTITVPNASGTLPLLELAQTWGAVQTFGANVLFSADNTHDIGASGASRPKNIYAAGSGDFPSYVNAGLYITPAGGYLRFTDRGFVEFSGDGILRLTNYAYTDFNRIVLGGTTSSFPAIKRSATDIHFKLADDSGFTGISSKSLTTYGLYAGVGDYERGGLSWATGNLNLFTEELGSGAARDIEFTRNGSLKMTIGASSIDVQSDVIVFGNVGVNGFTDAQSALGVVLLGESTGPTGDPTGGGILWSHSDGDLYYRGPTGGAINLSSGGGGAPMTTSTSSPEGAVTAGVTSLHYQNDTDVDVLWIKKMGSGNTGWVILAGAM